ncbi:ATP-grasp domain-containing protein [Catenuloplanes japonicus]|uniref:ATP-grasp domain-containing protein n=1 Tax=Catenuloplanes japonicus TaxID=33876 RepID=UPI0005268DE6|nr:ATP-grasp domain-containing protein [Catenuloplanes japonicus]
MTRPLLALLHHRVGLPWIFEAAEREGVDLLFIPRPGDTTAPPATEVLIGDALTDPDTLLAALADRRPDGILTMYDPAVPFAARAAAALGLPGVSEDAARRAVDKRALRESLAAAGANTPGYATVLPGGATDRAARLRFPVVVKPAAGFSSLGVVRVDHPDELPAALRQVEAVAAQQLPASAAARGTVVEEFVAGAEYAVESFVHAGRTHVLSVGFKGEPKGPYFEEGVYRAPAVLRDDVLAAIVAEAALANAALGISTGPVHTELRLRDGETPFVFDVGARIGGSGVSHFIVAESAGIDLAAESIRAAIGRPPISLPPLPAHIGTPSATAGEPPMIAHAGNYIVQTGGTGRIASIDGLAEAATHPAVRHVAQFLFPGDEVRAYPEFSGYPAFILSVHPTAAALEAFHQHLDDSITVRYAR